MDQQKYEKLLEALTAEIKKLNGYLPAITCELNHLKEAVEAAEKSEKIEYRKKGVNMEKFNIEITETLQKVVSVEAKTLAEAIEKVKEDYNDGEIELDAMDLVETTYEEFEGDL